MTHKQETKERRSTHSPSLGIKLDKGDLAELWLRRLHAGTIREEYSHGAMSFPRHRVLQDPQLNEYINLLESEGRARVDIRLQRCGGDASSGNVVVYPKPDASVEEAIQAASTQALDPILRVFKEGVVPINSVTVLPNTSHSSNSKAKGVVIEAEQRADKWWRGLQPLNWSLGRGLRVVALGMDAEHFIDQSDVLLAYTLQTARVFPHGSLKYVSFLHDQDGQMYMAVAGGPTHAETADNLQTLAKTPKRAQAQEFIQTQKELYRTRREMQVRALASVLGVDSGELATDVTYISVNVDLSLLVSGAADEIKNGLAPFTVGNAGIILHPDHSGGVVPIGTKLISQVPGFEPMLPTGVRANHRLSQAPPSLFNREDIAGHIATFSHPLELQTLALGFHADWR